ncbi:YcxB family protein [Pseudomonadota bacterium AL_CKDN230030165-1A_HGKHYDSX7]
MTPQATYTLTPGDYAAMTVALTRRSWARRLLKLTLWVLVFWVALSCLTGIWNPLTLARIVMASGGTPWIGGALLFAALLILFGHWIAWGISFLYYRQLSSAGATITLALTDDAVEATSNVADTRVPWISVKRVIADSRHIFLAISKREALILPRRAFASEADFDAARRYAETRQKAAA